VPKTSADRCFGGEEVNALPLNLSPFSSGPCAGLRSIRRSTTAVSPRGKGVARSTCFLALFTTLAALVLAGGAGCSSSPVDRRSGSRAAASPDDARAWDVRRPAAASATEAPRPDEKNPGAPATALPAYTVRETAFSDFGMSVKTNFDVQWGGHVAWMVVTAIDAGSSAARQRLGVGDRILALDGRQITAFDRDAMLAALFHRKHGETSRLLVLGPKDALPRFVTLVARRP
jgi:hypothetical protein